MVHVVAGVTYSYCTVCNFIVYLMVECFGF